MGLQIFLLPLLVSAAAALDPVASCRATHEGDSAAHIACLEAALGSAGEASTAAETAEESVQPTGLGAEQVIEERRLRESEPAQTTVRIVSASYDREELGTFQLADDQVWRETEKTPRHLRLKPGQEYSARIEKGKLGGYRMYIDGKRRMLKVERLQ